MPNRVPAKVGSFWQVFTSAEAEHGIFYVFVILIALGMIATFVAVGTRPLVLWPALVGEFALLMYCAWRTEPEDSSTEDVILEL